MREFEFKVKLRLDRTHPENEVADFFVNALRNQAQLYAVSSAFHHIEVEINGHATTITGKLGEGQPLDISVDQAKLEATDDPSVDRSAEGLEEGEADMRDSDDLQEDDDDEPPVVNPDDQQTPPPSTQFNDEMSGTNNPTNGMVTDPPPAGAGITPPTPASNPGQPPVVPTTGEASVAEDLVDGYAGPAPDANATPAPAKTGGGGFKKK